MTTKSFDNVYVAQESLLGPEKSRFLYNEYLSTIPLEGATAEIGVYQGKTSKLIHSLTPHKTHYCYDTFCGIQGSNKEIDKHTDGEFSCGLDAVKSIINMDNVIYRVGFFPDTFQENNVMFSFVHSDTDTYIGTKSTIEILKNRMVNGGKILFDDYEWMNCPGVKKAISEFIDSDTMFEHRRAPNTPQYVLTRKNNVYYDLPTYVIY